MTDYLFLEKDNPKTLVSRTSDNESRSSGTAKTPLAGAIATHFLTNVPVSPNIPVASVRHPVLWSAIVIFLIVVASALNGFISFIDWYTIDSSVTLTPGVSVFAVLKNCDVSFSESPLNESYVTVRSWLIYMERVQQHTRRERRLDELPIDWNHDQTVLKIRLALTRRYKFFLCSVHFHLNKNFIFNELHINYAPAESYIDVVSTTTIQATEALHFSVLHGVLDFQILYSPLIHIKLGDGSLRFNLGDYASFNGSSKIAIKSRSAPVHIKSNSAISLRMPRSSASRALIRSQRGRIHLANEGNDVMMHLSPKTIFQRINEPYNELNLNTIEMDIDIDTSGFYLDVLDQQDEKNEISLTTWAGEEHLEEPHLLPWSIERLDNIKSWLDYEPFSPWIIEILEHRTGLTKGSWRYLSSSAYLRGDNWFVLFSAGLLQPRQKIIQIHVMGIFCRSRNELELTPVIPDEQTSQIEIDSSSSSSSIGSFWDYGTKKKNFFNQSIYDLKSQSMKHHNNSTLLFEFDLGADLTLHEHLLRLKDFRHTKPEMNPPGRFIGHTLSPSRCEQELLADTFLVLWRALADTRTEATMIVHHENEFNYDIRFNVKDDAVVQDVITWGDIWFFIVAILVNIGFAGVLACVGTSKIHKFCASFLLEDFNTQAILCTASHRLDHEVTKLEENGWSLSVTRVYYPTSGFTLRWNHEPSVPYKRFGVHIRPIDMNSWMTPNDPNNPLSYKSCKIDPSESQFTASQKKHIGDSKDIYLYLPLSAAKAAQDVVVHQRQLFLPFKQPGKVQIECQQCYSLDSNSKYRFQLQAINTQGRVVDQSVWSHEVRPATGLMFVDLPLLIVRRFCPIRKSSLEMFVRKHVLKTPLHITRLKLHSFVLEMFTDEGSVKTTTRRRLLRGTMKVRQSGPQTRRNQLFNFSNSSAIRSATDITIPQQNNGTSLMNRTLSDCIVSFQLLLSLTSTTIPSTIEDRRLTTQRILFYGRPDVVAAQGGGQTLLQLRGDSSQAITLVQSRISQTLVSVDLSDGNTGRRVAAGFVRLSDIYGASQTEGSPGLKPLEIHVRLDHVDSVGQWGRLTFMMFVPGLQEYERHSIFQLDSLPKATTLVQHKNTINTILAHQSTTTGMMQSISYGNILRNRYFNSLLPVISPLNSPMQSPRHKLSHPSNHPEQEIQPLHSFWSDTDSNILSFEKSSMKHPIDLSTQAYEPSEILYLANKNVYFTKDVPAAQYLEGTDMTISWSWNLAGIGSYGSLNASGVLSEAKPDNVYLHLMDHNTNQYLSPVHLGHPIPNTGAYSWTTKVAFESDKSVRSCYLLLSAEAIEPGQQLEAIAASNTFFVLRCLPLCEFEICYAAFCRTHKLEMEHLSDSKLLESGLVVFEANVKVCPDLRHPVPFEPPVSCIHCPGQCVPSSVSKLVKLIDPPTEKVTNASTATAIEGPINVYKAVSQKLKVVENCQINRDSYWWLDSPDSMLLRFDLPFHSLLFQWVQSYINRNRRLKWILRFVTPKTLWDPGQQSREETFRKLRYLEFKIFPLIVQMFIIGLQLFWFSFIPLFILLGYIEYDRLLASFIERPHQDADPNYILDFVFNPSLSFIFSLRFPGTFVVISTLSWLLFICVAVLFSPVIREKYPRLRRAAQFAGLGVQWLTVLLSTWLILMFVLWLVLGALINSEGFLPYAVMSASVFFAVYTVSSSFSGAREIVARFIEENLELLLSVAMGHWFESMGHQDGDQKEMSDVHKSIQKTQRFREKIRETRAHLFHTYRMGYDKSVLSTGVSIDLDSDAGSKFRSLRESVCTYIFQKVNASPGNVFTFINGKPSGLENETTLPIGTRFATVTEVERNVQKINNLIHGFEVACLQDGVKYGPRFNNKVERHPENGSEFTSAFVAVPRYPQPNDLSEETKVALVFGSFDKDEDDYLNEVELTMWQAILKKPEFAEWDQAVVHYAAKYGVEMDYEKGATVQSLSQYYTSVKDDLDKDYKRLFPIVSDGIEGDDAVEEVSSLGSELDELGLDEDDDNDFGLSEDEPDEGYNVSGGLEDAGYSDFRAEQNRLDQRLATNLNTQLLQKIYGIVTQEQQEKRFNKADFPDSFLALKIVTTQFSFLLPVFPITTILANKPRRSSGGSSTGGAMDDTLTELLKYVGLEATQELLSQFHTYYYEMFDPTVIQSSISDFFDNVITQRIQSKAQHILNIRLDLQKSDLQKSSLELMQTGLPKTAFQVWRLLRRYRLSRDTELREKLADASVSGPLQMQIQVSLVVQVLVEVKVLQAEEIEKQFAEIVTSDGAYRELVLWMPHRRECSQFIASLIESHVGRQSSRLTTEDLAYVSGQLISNHLWLGAFLMLLQLMGISLPNDELPGEAIWIPNDPYNQSAAASLQIKDRLDLSSTETGDPSIWKEKGNLTRVKKVFDQLSNNTGFLPVDLADEAILLLTDNCLNYAGVIACLQHLNLGSVGKVGTEDVNNVLLELGFLPDSVCYDIEPSSDLKEDVLDWTVYREGNWLTDELTRTFYRLTISSPGFMGKSQMIEFTREIEKLFQGQSVLVAAKKNQGRRRTLQPIEWPINTAEDGNPPLGQLPYTTTNSYLEESLMTFEMYHRAALKLGFSCSRPHSRLMWVLYSNTAFGGVRQFLPAGELATFTIRLYLQPAAQSGSVLGRDEMLEDAVAFRGCLNFLMFRRLVRRLGITIHDKGVKNIWDDLPKDPLEISYKDSATGLATTKYLRLEMDVIGFDTMKGRTVHVDIIRRDLAKFFCTGLWPEAVIVLFNLRLQLDISEARIENVLQDLSWKLNRYGLLRPDDVPTAMSDATVEGLTFGMLRELLMKMRLRLPEQDVKRMFDLMDVNHDHTLDLRELLAGFEMLFQRFVPNQIVDAVGLSYIQQLYVTAAVVGCLVALFSFIGFAFTAFVGLRSGVSAAVQSIIALIGAVGLQSGASESIDRVQKRMKNRIAIIVGEDLDRKMKEQQEVENSISMKLAAEKKVIHDKKPLEVRYTLPQRYRPDLNDPKPCVTFHPGDEVFLEPVVAGAPGIYNLTWHIQPRMPPKTGLVFDTRTGILSGTIPQPDAINTNTGVIPVERLLGNQGALYDALSGGSNTFDLTSSLSRQPRLPSFSRQITEEISKQIPNKLSAGGPLSAAVRRHVRHVGRQVRMAKRTFVVVAQNDAGSVRCRITFQIVPHPRETVGNATIGTQIPDSKKIFDRENRGLGGGNRQD